MARMLLARAQSTESPRVVGFDRAVLDRLMEYPWPGNVRELQNCIEHVVTLSSFDHVRIEDLPEKIRRWTKPATAIESGSDDDLLPANEVEWRHIVRVITAVGGNKKKAAQILGFDRRTLYRKLERNGGLHA